MPSETSERVKVARTKMRNAQWRYRVAESGPAYEAAKRALDAADEAFEAAVRAESAAECERLREERDLLGGEVLYALRLAREYRELAMTRGPNAE